MENVQKTLILWAGLAIGGNMIAAPAKFQVTTLNYTQLLQIGRAQFSWLGIAEVVLAIAVGAMVIWVRKLPHVTLWAVFAVFAAQQIVLQPMLAGRSDIIVAGGTVGQSNLHIVFIVAEIAKIGLLLWSARRT